MKAKNAPVPKQSRPLLKQAAKARTPASARKTPVSKKPAGPKKSASRSGPTPNTKKTKRAIPSVSKPKAPPAAKKPTTPVKTGAARTPATRTKPSVARKAGRPGKPSIARKPSGPVEKPVARKNGTPVTSKAAGKTAAPVKSATPASKTTSVARKPIEPEFSSKSPRQAHFRMPAEWEQHFGTFMTWPNKKGISFPGKGAFEAVLPTFESMLRALISSEELFVNVSSEEDRQTIRDFLTIAEQRKVHFVDTPVMEPWCRDHGCSFVVRDTDRAGGAIIWKFNAWGAKYSQALADAQISLRMAQYLGGKLFNPGIILEGGSIEVNGSGTVLTTESCLLNKNRNKGLKKEDAERVLKDFLNVKNVLWLPGGLEGDDTDGHIDTITRFVNRNTVLSVLEDNPKDRNYAGLKRNFELLQGMKIEDGTDLQVIPLPMPQPIVRKNQRLPASYANFYITNKVVLLPTFDDPADEKALEIMVKSFPSRRIFPIDCRELVWGLGAFHCLTQQLPLAAFPKVIDLIRNPQPSPRPVY